MQSILSEIFPLHKTKNKTETLSELDMSSAKVGLGLGARGLKDKDWGPGVSDPYVVISR